MAVRVILDAHGGDHAPLEPLRGAALAVAEYGVEVLLCGDEQQIRSLSEQNGISLNGIDICHTTQVMPVEANPTEITRTYAESSMAVGLKLLAEGKGDTFVGPGSTGAMVVGASLIVKRIKGIKRPALATIIPSASAGGCYMLIDGGANAECRPEMLVQFGIMGSAYMQKVMNVNRPRVGLVNIGTEDNKGLDLHVQSNQLLQKAPVHFIGNVEARELPLGGCDVAVADGFVGNVILKLTEGMGKMMTGELKDMLMKNAFSKLAAGMLKGSLGQFRKRMDYTEYGGAPLMGIARPVIKAHGSSNANAFKNAIRQAKQVCEQQVIPQIEQSLSELTAE